MTVIILLALCVTNRSFSRHEAFLARMAGNAVGTMVALVVGETNLKTEICDNFETGLIGNRFKELPIAGITLLSSAFYNRYKNFIVYTRYKNDFWVRSNRMVYPAENRDKVYIYGSELSREFNISKWIESPNGLSVRWAIGYNQDKSQTSY